MTDPKPTAASPWDFRARAFVFGIIYGIGFFVGINLQFNLYGSYQPAYAYLGAQWGAAGTHVAAFLPVVFTAAAQFLRMWGTAYLSSGIVWSSNTVSKGLLVSGPYRHVRNPLYLGNILAAVGIGLVGPPYTLLIVVVGVTAFVLRLISVEERYLSGLHGQDYLEYCRMVPRLVPRWSPIPAAADPHAPKWADGFWGEIFHTAFVVTALYNALFTWAEPSMSLWFVFIGTLAIFALVRRIATGKSPATA